MASPPSSATGSAGASRARSRQCRAPTSRRLCHRRRVNTPSLVHRRVRARRRPPHRTLGPAGPPRPRSGPIRPDSFPTPLMSRPPTGSSRSAPADDVGAALGHVFGGDFQTGLHRRPRGTGGKREDEPSNASSSDDLAEAMAEKRSESSRAGGRANGALSDPASTVRGRAEADHRWTMSTQPPQHPVVRVAAAGPERTS